MRAPFSRGLVLLLLVAATVAACGDDGLGSGTTTTLEAVTTTETPTTVSPTTLTTSTEGTTTTTTTEAPPEAPVCTGTQAATNDSFIAGGVLRGQLTGIRQFPYQGKTRVIFDFANEDAPFEHEVDWDVRYCPLIGPCGGIGPPPSVGGDHELRIAIGPLVTPTAPGGVNDFTGLEVVPIDGDTVTEMRVWQTGDEPTWLLGISGERRDFQAYTWGPPDQYPRLIIDICDG